MRTYNTRFFEFSISYSYKDLKKFISAKSFVWIFTYLFKLNIGCNEKSINSCKNNVFIQDLTWLTKYSKVNPTYVWEHRSTSLRYKDVLQSWIVFSDYIPAFLLLKIYVLESYFYGILNKSWNFPILLILFSTLYQWLSCVFLPVFEDASFFFETSCCNFKFRLLYTYKNECKINYILIGMSSSLNGAKNLWKNDSYSFLTTYECFPAFIITGYT